MAVVMKLFKHASGNTCNFTLKGAKETVRFGNSQGLDFHETRQMAIDIRTSLKRLGINFKFIPYVCCPRCCRLYLESEAYPDRCTGVQFPNGETCGEEITSPSENGRSRRPIRRFFYRSPIKWLARLLQRPGIEDLADVPRTREKKEILEDIFDGEFLQNLFVGSGTQKRWFFADKGRYAFALGIDGYGPDTARSKKTKSIASMYLALINLPIQFRYRLENVCIVGMIPGGEPLVEDQQINNFLRPLTNDLKILWNPGVFLLSTFRYPEGRSINGALGLIINDLKAARPVGGFVATSHTVLCSCCDCRKEDLHDVDKVFVHRDASQHIRDGIAWRDATSQAQRTEIEDRTGTRWTVLMELPYFDGPRMTVPEGLHAPQNVESTHCRDNFGMFINKADGLGEGAGIKGKSWPDREAYRKAEGVMFSGLKGEVDSLAARSAQALALVRGIEIAGLKHAGVVQCLHEWVGC